MFGAVLLFCEHSEASVSADELREARTVLNGSEDGSSVRELTLARAERYLLEENSKIVSRMGFEELDRYLDKNNLRETVKLELQEVIKKHITPVGKTARRGDLEAFEKAVRLPTKTGVNLKRAMKIPELMAKDDMRTMFRSYVNLFLHRGDLQSALGMAGRYRSHAERLQETGKLEPSEWKEIAMFCENVAASRSNFKLEQ